MNRVISCNILIRAIRNPDYRIVVKTVDGAFEAWLYNKEYGVSTLMFGEDMLNMSLATFLDIVYANIDEYIDLYKKEFEDEEPERVKYIRSDPDVTNNLPF